ncbi:hypothetical protein LTR15_007179 [Elasticomyces elasticus]|nr:hypothetical protein LTR15_007179 [Elasticomyces elasticus]
MADATDPRTPLNSFFVAEYTELQALYDAVDTDEEWTTLSGRLDAALANHALPRYFRASYEVIRAFTSPTPANNIHRAECWIQNMQEMGEAAGHQPKKVQESLQDLTGMVAFAKENLLESEGDSGQPVVVAEPAATEDESGGASTEDQSGGAEGTGEQ